MYYLRVVLGLLGDRVESRLLLAPPRRRPRLPVVIVGLVMLQFVGSVAEMILSVLKLKFLSLSSEGERPKTTIYIFVSEYVLLISVLIILIRPC